VNSGRRTGRWRPTVCTWSALLALAAAAFWSGGRRDGAASGAGHAVAERVSAGRVCRSTLPPGMELSCGTYGFGDLRHVCAGQGRGGTRCMRTSQVTVRNTGRSEVYVSSIAGPREGVREQGPQQAVEPGGEATLRPGEGRLLFDITLRGTAAGPGTVEVVGVR